MELGFNLVEDNSSSPITIETLSLEMMFDLIKCFSAKIQPEDVEARYKLDRANINEINYGIIPKNVIELFYYQLQAVKLAIIDIVIGNFHIGNVPEDITIETEDWIWGIPPTNVNELKETLYYIVSRDFYEQGSWVYAITEGDFESLKPFLDAVVDYSIMFTNDGDYNSFSNLIKNKFPFIQD